MQAQHLAALTAAWLAFASLVSPALAGPDDEDY